MDYSTILSLHNYYLQVESLVKTCEWAKIKYEIEMTRHQLSRLFRQNELHVNPPNGRADLYWEDLSKYKSPESEFAADLIRGTFKDIVTYEPGGDYVGWLTACHFLDSPLYRLALNTLLNNSNITVDPQAIYGDSNLEFVDGILDVAQIQIGKEVYNAGYTYWVASLRD